MGIAATLAVALALVGNAAAKNTHTATNSTEKPEYQCAPDSDGQCCVTYAENDGIVPSVNAQLEYAIPHSGFALEGNALGQQGRRSTLNQCVLTGTKSSAIGWKWSRGATPTKCHLKPSCPEPACLAQFSMLQLRYGTSPLSGQSTGAKDLPTQHSSLASLAIKLTVDIKWEDINGGMQQKYRNSLLFDMFLSTKKPDGTQMGDAVTDEIVVDTSYNPGYAPLCTGFRPTPLEEVKGPDGHVWLYQISIPGDKPDGHSVTYMNHFTLQSGGKSAEGADTHVSSSFDLLPIIQAVQRRAESQARSSGLWLGDITIGSALSDNTKGQVTFPSLPVIEAKKKNDASSVVV